MPLSGYPVIRYRLCPARLSFVEIEIEIRSKHLLQGNRNNTGAAGLEHTLTTHNCEQEIPIPILGMHSPCTGTSIVLYVPGIQYCLYSTGIQGPYLEHIHDRSRFYEHHHARLRVQSECTRRDLTIVGTLPGRQTATVVGHVRAEMGVWCCGLLRTQS